MTTQLTSSNIALKNFAVDWQAVKTSNFTAVAGEGYFVNTTSAAITVTLPASAEIGDIIRIKDYAGTFASNNLTIARNGHNIQGVANDSLIETNRASISLFYVDSTKGWLYNNESNVADLEEPFIAATGGTVTTSGDYKIHTFTGDGCFVVSQISPSSAPIIKRSVDYLVVAGGGAGGGATPSAVGGGGGGAGGFRTSSVTFCGPPLASCCGIIVSSVTYPITVGAGGGGVNAVPNAPVNARGNPGSNSIFSTITSAGGGAGGIRNTSTPRPYSAPTCNVMGFPGGSGGGTGSGGPTYFPSSPGPTFDARGLGNNPTVSPPQGNNGGPDSPGQTAVEGGGGAGADGGNNTGGAGETSSISGSSVAYAGGGGAGNPCGTGGIGGGGDGATCGVGTGSAGTANTGGGGGGSDGPSPGLAGGSGGKGIVIIRYKYQ